MNQFRRSLITWSEVIVAVLLFFFMLQVASAQAAELKLPGTVNSFAQISP